MKALMEINDCRECPFHKSYDVETPDSFDNFLDIYCRKIDSSDGRGRRICQVDGPEKAPVPSWCPFVIKSYRSVLEQLKFDYKHKNRKDLKETTKFYWATEILRALENHSFSGFTYPSFQGMRDYCLVTIALELRRESPLIQRSLERLDVEDLEIIDDKVVATSVRTAKIIEDFKQEKRKAEAKGLPMVLGTELAVPLAMLMADILDVPRKTRMVMKKVTSELSFLERGIDENSNPHPLFSDRGKDESSNPHPVESANLRYYYEADARTTMDVDVNKFLTNDNRAALCRVLKEIFGIKELTIFISNHKDYKTETKISLDSPT